MEQFTPTAAPIKSALFVDFDNIYIGLSKSDPAAAERFASDPARWLNWLERGLPDRSNGLASAPRERSILIRRCYPNPDAGFRRFRSFFTSAAFSVIDCPTLTRTGKNSSDIYMVMDILDTLSHRTNFDEFIIFSGDSDFMPVLLRLRAHDRRTTTLAIDFMPPAYKAACDLVISEEEFIEDALGVSHEGSSASTSRARVPMVTLKEMAARVYSVACQDSEVAGADLPDILKDFREFRDSNNWLGFGTSQRLAEALVSCEPRLFVTRINPMMYKLGIKSQTVKPEIYPVEFPKTTPMVLAEKPQEAPVQYAERADYKPGSTNSAAEKPAEKADRKPARGGVRAVEKNGKAELSRLRVQVLAIVKEMVANSPIPILLARASQHVVSTVGPRVLETQWAGAGSFKRLLQGAGDLGLEITTQPEPGYIFDPQRHTHPGQRVQLENEIPDYGMVEGQAVEPGSAAPLTGENGLGVEGESIPVEMAPSSAPSDPFRMNAITDSYGADEEGEEPEDEDEDDEDYGESLPSLEEFARRVSQVTGTPDLTQEQYAQVFRGIVEELHRIAQGQKVYNTYQSSKTVSEWCAEHGEAVSRSDVVLVFKGIIFQDGVRFGKRPDSYTAHELANVVRNNIKALCRRSRLELTEYENHLLEEWIMGGLENEITGVEPSLTPSETVHEPGEPVGDQPEESPSEGPVNG